MSEYLPQNAAYQQCAAFGSSFNETAIFNLEIDLEDGSIGSTNFDVVPSQVSPGEYNIGNQTALIAEAEDQVLYDSDEPLTLNFATRFIAGSTFNNQNPIVHDFDEPTTREFQIWKEGWEEKLRIVEWKRAGKDWEDITQSSKKMQGRSYNTRKSMLARAVREVEALGNAIAADREGEAVRLRDLLLFNTMGEAVRVDFNSTWARVAESVKDHGSIRKWTSHRVKYAWNNGVSDLFPHIQLHQRNISQVILV